MNVPRLKDVASKIRPETDSLSLMTLCICSARGGKDGKIYMRWCFPQNKDRKPSEKGLPWKVDLGSRERAIKILEAFVKVLKGEAKSERQQPQISETDYPF